MKRKINIRDKKKTPSFWKRERGGLANHIHLFWRLMQKSIYHFL